MLCLAGELVGRAVLQAQALLPNYHHQVVILQLGDHHLMYINLGTTTAAAVVMWAAAATGAL
jgi:hypothetical protein